MENGQSSAVTLEQAKQAASVLGLNTPTGQRTVLSDEPPSQGSVVRDIDRNYTVAFGDATVNTPAGLAALGKLLERFESDHGHDAGMQHSAELQGAQNTLHLYRDQLSERLGSKAASTGVSSVR